MNGFRQRTPLSQSKSFQCDLLRRALRLRELESSELCFFFFVLLLLESSDESIFFLRPPELRFFFLLPDELRFFIFLFDLVDSLLVLEESAELRFFMLLLLEESPLLRVFWFEESDLSDESLLPPSLLPFPVDDPMEEGRRPLRVMEPDEPPSLPFPVEEEPMAERLFMLRDPPEFPVPLSPFPLGEERRMGCVLSSSLSLPFEPLLEGRLGRLTLLLL